eukprot:jgi/Botrbrau1/23665/Bobra.55_2s0046.1
MHMHSAMLACMHECMLVVVRSTCTLVGASLKTNLSGCPGAASLVPACTKKSVELSCNHMSRLFRACHFYSCCQDLSHTKPFSTKHIRKHSRHLLQNCKLVSPYEWPLERKDFISRCNARRAGASRNRRLHPQRC